METTIRTRDDASTILQMLVKYIIDAEKLAPNEDSGAPEKYILFGLSLAVAEHEWSTNVLSQMMQEDHSVKEATDTVTSVLIKLEGVLVAFREFQAKTGVIVDDIDDDSSFIGGLDNDFTIK
jgi:hypothetical protein